MQATKEIKTDKTSKADQQPLTRKEKEKMGFFDPCNGNGCHTK